MLMQRDFEGVFIGMSWQISRCSKISRKYSIHVGHVVTHIHYLYSVDSNAALRSIMH